MCPQNHHYLTHFFLHFQGQLFTYNLFSSRNINHFCFKPSFHKQTQTPAVPSLHTQSMTQTENIHTQYIFIFLWSFTRFCINTGSLNIVPCNILNKQRGQWGADCYIPFPYEKAISPICTYGFGLSKGIASLGLMATLHLSRHKRRRPQAFVW